MSVHATLPKNAEGKRLASLVRIPPTAPKDAGTTVVVVDDGAIDDKVRRIHDGLVVLSVGMFKGHMAFRHRKPFPDKAFCEAGDKIEAAIKAENDVHDDDRVKFVLEGTHIEKRRRLERGQEATTKSTAPKIPPLPVSMAVFKQPMGEPKSTFALVNSFHEANGWIKSGLSEADNPPFLFEEEGKNYLMAKLVLSMAAHKGCRGKEAGTFIDVRRFGRAVVKLFQDVFNTKACRVLITGATPFTFCNFGLGDAETRIYCYHTEIAHLNRCPAVRIPATHLFPVVSNDKIDHKAFQFGGNGCEVASAVLDGELRPETLSQHPLKKTIADVQEQWPSQTGKLRRFEGELVLIDELESTPADHLFVSLNFILEAKRFAMDINAVRALQVHLKFVMDTLQYMHDKQLTFWYQLLGRDLDTDSDADADYYADAMALE
jgi:hypothetical protein